MPVSNRKTESNRKSYSIRTGPSQKNTFDNQYNLEEYGINLINDEDKILVDTIKWNGNAKKAGIEMGDYITEFKIENSNRPSKKLVYPIALLLLLVFGYLNKRRTI